MKLRLQILTASGISTTLEHAGPTIRLGRDCDCEIALNPQLYDVVSREHAQVELTPAGAVLSNLSKVNATLLNDKVIDKAPLRRGDRIQLGHTGPALQVLAIDLSLPDAVAGPRKHLPVLATVMAVVALAGAGIAIWANRSNTPRETQEDLRAQEPSPAQEKGRNTVPVDPPDKRGDPEPPKPLPEKLLPPPPPPIPEVKAGVYLIPEKSAPSLLLQRRGEFYPWVPLVSGSPVFTSHTLISLAGYQSLLVLDSNLHLTLWGNLPEFSPSPVLESMAVLNAPEEGFDLDLTLERGRIHLVNRKPEGAARVRFRFRSEAWELVLEPRSQLVADLWLDLPRPESLDSPPSAHLAIHTDGPLQVQTGKHEHPLSGSMKLHWRSQTPAALLTQKLPQPPEWWTKAPPLTDSVKDALAAVTYWKQILASSGEVVDTIRNGINNLPDATDRKVGVLFLGALDASEPLLTFMMGHQNIDVRNTASYAIQLWMNRSSHHPDELARLLKGQKYAADKIDRILKLLRGHTQKELAQSATYQELIDDLNNDELIIRDLAYIHLSLRVPGAKKIPFNPLWNKDQRRPALEAWRKLVPEKNIPPLP